MGYLGNNLRIDDIRYIRDLNAFSVEIWRVSREKPPDKTHWMSDDTEQLVTKHFLLTLRHDFPYVTVVFHDGNVDEAIFLKVDISSYQTKGLITETLGPNPLPPKIGRPSKIRYMIANAGFSEILGLIEGLDSEHPPAVFLFCLTKKPMINAPLLEVIATSESYDHMFRSLLMKSDIVIYPGPDADYYVVSSVNKAILEDIFGKIQK